MAKFDKTPGEMKAPILAAMLDHIPFDGWSEAALKHAAGDLGLPVDFLRMAFPGGLQEMVETHLQTLDKALEAKLKKKNLGKMKIRERIKVAVLLRLKLNEPYREAVRRTVGFLALPQNAPLSAKCLWRTVDLMWRAAGDTSTDYNHYTKRILLGGVYSTTLLAWLGDTSEGFSETEKFLERRVDNVMEVEKLKSRVREATKDLPDPFEILGRMRYPQGHKK